MIILTWAGLILAAIPLLLFVLNAPFFRRLGPRPRGGAPQPLSVLIPARDEEERLGPTLDALLASEGISFEVIVADDASSDGTAEVVRSRARADSRVRLLSLQGPPPGWNGKQHACHRLSEEARHPILLFLDADVRVSPDALARLVATMEKGDHALLSGFPRQETHTLVERLLLPLIHFVLLGFLPLIQARRTTDPAFAAGCGQLMCVRAKQYRNAGGHAAIAASRHDGIQLPRAFRRAGFKTALFDATDLAACRMYESAAEVWRGLAKNADEGLAKPAAIGPWTLLLVGGQVLPWCLLAAGAGPILSESGSAYALVGACLAGPMVRGVMSLRFRQSGLSALLHPIGVGLLVAVQWYAFALGRRGEKIAWRGRV